MIVNKYDILPNYFVESIVRKNIKDQIKNNFP